MTRNCAFCGILFSLEGMGFNAVLCPAHRRFPDGRQVKGARRCQVCDVPFLMPYSGVRNCPAHYGDRSGYQRRASAKRTACQTCGGPVPETRTDRRYCDWRHDMDLLDARERAELIREYPCPERGETA